MFVASFTGNLVRDPESRTAGQNNVTNFTVAVNRGGDKDSVYISCAAWGKLGATVQAYTHKGSHVTVVGSLNDLSTYTAKDGSAKPQLSLTVVNIDFGPKTTGSSSGNTAAATRPAEPYAPARPDPEPELPF